MNNKVKTIQLTSAEIEVGLIQIGYRMDELKRLQVQEGKDGNVARVLELEEFMRPIKSLYSKLMESL